MMRLEKFSNHRVPCTFKLPNISTKPPAARRRPSTGIAGGVVACRARTIRFPQMPKPRQ